jgi:predicted ATP-dependent endonuclease of OLD family
MLNTLQVKNFTLFSDATMKFAPGLNIMVGDNGTGKTILLKLAYAIQYVLHKALQESLHSLTPISMEALNLDLSRKLKNVFQAEKLSNLCSTHGVNAQINMIINSDLTIEISLAENLEFNIKKHNEITTNNSLPIFIPGKEVLSIYPGFITSYEDRELAFDETYYDLCKALSRTPLRGKRREEINNWLAPLEPAIPGKLINQFNRFYLQFSEQEKREIPLVAEGIRKIALLNYLILNGSITKTSTLFWDEPEINLNAKLQVKLVDSLVQLANAGVQIVLVIHDLFLLKELALRVDANETKANFFEFLEQDNTITIKQGENLEDLSQIVALDASLDQYDRIQEVLMQDF